jgi:hypothetical protein
MKTKINRMSDFDDYDGYYDHDEEFGSFDDGDEFSDS